MAWKKRTWVSDPRHQWSDWSHGAASLAVDGNNNSHLQQCTLISNQNVDPTWMVDIGKRNYVRGVVITNWRGQGEG